MSNIDVVLIMKPDTFTDPTIVSHMKFPRKFDSRSRPEHDAVADVSAEHT
jgi:hypothetical protein